VKELTRDFEAAIDHYIADCAATGRKPLKAASGKMMLRVSPEVHARAQATAQTAGKSLNQWAEEVIDKAPRSEIRGAEQRLPKKNVLQTSVPALIMRSVPL
jgi:predicted HicB family RNase H-like nuclease